MLVLEKVLLEVDNTRGSPRLKKLSKLVIGIGAE